MLKKEGFDVVTAADGVEGLAAFDRQGADLVVLDLLELLLRNPGRVLTRGQLIDRIWGSDYVGGTKTLDVHIKRLRSKIEPDSSHPTRLITVRGLGCKYEG